MDKRYQVFISSTFSDLKEERQAGLKAILELDHMPAGMELFPAADDSAWELIQDVIDSSDYYVLIIGGKYGSLDEAGLGYTEKEYDYAIAAKKPVIPLLHKNPDNLPRDKTETDEAAWAKLTAFRSKIESRHTCDYWSAADDLKARVIVGLTKETKRHPAIGWVRADTVPSDATLSDVLALKNHIAELEADAAAARDRPPAGTEDLASGEDVFAIHLNFTARKRDDSNPFAGDQRYQGTIQVSWNALFAAVAPCIIDEATDATLRKAIEDYVRRKGYETFDGSDQFKENILLNFAVEGEDVDTCIIQMRALGLIRASLRKRSVHDKKSYWSLTPYGDTLMAQLRAVRRTPLAEVLSGRAEADEDAEESGDGDS
ncbi:MAG: DUF4062 domain-containing protein [Gaiellales bacterium]|nr:DUF4062 domain-containing protein [Gaiellales bacterium]